MDSNIKIREKIQEILSEDFGQGIDSFVDKVKKIYTYGFVGRPNESVDTSTGTIKFTIELEVKSWGIRDLSINIIDFAVDRVVVNDETEQSREETIIYVENGVAKEGFQIKVTKNSGKGQILVYEADINESRKEIEITFDSL